MHLKSLIVRNVSYVLRTPSIGSEGAIWQGSMLGVLVQCALLHWHVFISEKLEIRCSPSELLGKDLADRLAGWYTHIPLGPALHPKSQYIIPNNGILKSNSSTFPWSEGYITQYTL